MKILVCGDIHCKPDVLLSAVKARSWDLFVFLGDACDNWGATQDENINTLSTVASLKREYGEKFVWLLGNHDWGYYDKTIRMSGHIYHKEDDVKTLLEDHFDDWDLYYFQDNLIFSHAGIDTRLLGDPTPYATLKRNRNAENMMNFVGYRSGGGSPIAGPLWARPEELAPIPNKIQIVGHTPVAKIFRTGNDTEGLILCDTFSQNPDRSPIGDSTLLYIEDGQFSAVDYKTGELKYELR